MKNKNIKIGNLYTTVYPNGPIGMVIGKNQSIEPEYTFSYNINGENKSCQMLAMELKPVENNQLGFNKTAQSTK